MPRPAPEPARRAALLSAAIAEVGHGGSLDVTVGNIARRAGMSPALAHHYFGSKDAMLEAAMRHILRALAAEARARLAVAEGPRARLSAIVAACFAADSFDADVIAAWLAFYVSARRSAGARRLLSVYQARLRAALRHDLRALTGDEEAAAETVAALIDGVYLRAAFGAPGMAPAEAVARIEAVLDLLTGVRA